MANLCGTVTYNHASLGMVDRTEDSVCFLLTCFVKNNVTYFLVEK